MEAAARKNDELFRRMMDEGSLDAKKTLLQAARLPDPNTIKVSE